MPNQTNPQYDALSRAFHWITAIAVALAFVLGPEGFGKLMDDGVDPATHIDIVLHESLGMLVLVLTLVRLVWVIFRPAAPVVEISLWMRLAAIGAKLGLWVLMLVLPITALLTLGSEGYPMTLLGGVHVVPMPWLSDSAIGSMLDWGEVHGLLGDLILILAGLHSVAALYHHVVLKDRVLATMLPFLNKR